MRIIQLLRTPACNTEQKILKFFLIIVLPALTILTTITIIDYKQSKDKIISKILRDESTNANSKIATFFDPIIRDTLFVQNLGHLGKLNPENHAEMDTFFKSFSNFYLQNVAQILIFDGTDTYACQLEKSNQNNSITHTDLLYDFNSSPIHKTDKGTNVEWYTGKYDHSNGESFLIATTFYQHPESKRTYSVALCIRTTMFLKDLGEHIVDNQKLFTLQRHNSKLSLIMFDFANNDTPVIRKINEKDLPEMQAAINAWQTENNKELISFDLEKNIWWASILKLENNDNDSYSVLLVSESSVLNKIRTGVLSLPIYLSIIVAVALTATFFLWRRYNNEIDLASQPPLLCDIDEKTLRELIIAGENDRLEFKSTLRWNLKANKPGKEIEFSCLKTIIAFLNSAGGTLIVGVEDNSDIIGISADNFPNDDKFLLHFNNLIKQHIGLVFSKVISFKTRQLDGKSILVVDCLNSDMPAFLKKGADEEFYIRVGPGSRKLAFSEILDYLNKN